MAKILGQARRSQLVTTYGVGAIIAIEDESFMIAGLDLWDADDQTLWIHEPRLERQCTVQHFVLPAASGDDKKNDIPVERFPRWYSCPNTGELDEYRHLAAAFDQNACGTCGTSLVPSRFVMVCDGGHIDDFPYHRWAHSQTNDPRGTRDGQHDLTITTLGLTASLRDIVIRCSCGASRSMEGSFRGNALTDVTPCTAQQPWLGRRDPEGCRRRPRVLQRGASNVWFPVVESAISIPPWSEEAFKVLNRYWEAIRHIGAADLPNVLAGMGLDRLSGNTVAELVDVVQERRNAETAASDAEGQSIKDQEFSALTRGKPQRSAKQDFVCVPAEDVTPAIAQAFNPVMVVKRLREVRVLTSFTRVKEPEAADLEERLSPLAKNHLSWLPAVEVIGEGIFLDLAGDRLLEWEAQERLLTRVEILRENARTGEKGKLPRLSSRITARLLLTHTLAHILINQWSLECGYPAASLRERLYVNDEHAALLIYTATSDSAGSLGGLISQANPERLEPSLRNAIATAAWCSSDPLCIESEPGGTDALNLAACHCCSLLPETSCEESNLLLDRATLVGIPGRFTGYFQGWTE
ncbi:DrmB family protein [Mycolicibacterium psychrotolerans]|uniref:DrmB family protein n=1 Tax=Mycolicibacterium psychrotolerans TaxID=216929 RepID=UPI003D67F5FB